MDLASILADVQAAVQLANLAVQVGQDAAPFVTSAYDILFKGTTLTADQRATMVAQETTLRETLDAQSIPADAP